MIYFHLLVRATDTALEEPALNQEGRDEYIFYEVSSAAINVCGLYSQVGHVPILVYK